MDSSPQTRKTRALHAVVPRRQAREAHAPRPAPDPAIARLQRRLNHLDYRDAAGRALAPDGMFGESTFEALVEFQRAHGLRADGVPGPRTVALLDPDAAQAARGADATIGRAGRRGAP